MNEHIELAAEDAWHAFTELTVCGFNSEEAVKLVPTVLFTADRRAGQ
jgi:hypothetical protein